MINSLSTYGGVMRQQNINSLLQSQISTLTGEASTGTYTDQATALGSRMSLLYNLQAQSAQNTAVQSATDTVSNKLTTMQTTLSSMHDVIETISNDALGASTASGSNSTYLSTMGTQGTGAMNQLLSMVNTTLNGQYVFSGQDSGTQTMASTADATGGPIAALNTLVSNAVSANGGAPLSADTLAGLQTSLDQMFSDSSGSASTNYKGAFFTATDNGNPVSVSVGGKQTVSYDMKGTSQGLRDVFKGLSMLQLLNSPGTQIDDSAKQALLSQATNSLLSGQNELTQEAALLGTKQQQVQTIHNAQQTAATAAQSQISGLLTVDAATVATNLSTLKTQLEASYEITSQVSQLSFVNYMK